MNWKQFYYAAGIGSEYKLVFKKSGLVMENLILISIAENTLFFREPLGSLFQLSEQDEAEIILVKGGYLNEPLQKKVEEIKKKCNRIGGHLSLFKCFAGEIQEAVSILNNTDSDSAHRLADVLSTETAVREHRLKNEDTVTLIKVAEEYLRTSPGVLSVVKFLIYYAANSYSGAMKVMTDQLAPNCDSSVYRMLGLINLYLGKAEAMYLYWMGKYYLQSPERIPEDNECGCDPEWIRYLDTCGNLICYKNLDMIISRLMNMGDDGHRCAYFSLTRLFQRAGFFSLACEAASYFSEIADFSPVGRPANELVRFLSTDEDSYCCFAMKAADAILADGLEDYSNPDVDDRIGYLYDYASGRHYGRILGYDLLTYFFATSNIPDRKRQQFNRNYDFSTYQRQRELAAPVRFKAGERFNQGSYAIEAFY